MRFFKLRRNTHCVSVQHLPYSRPISIAFCSKENAWFVFSFIAVVRSNCIRKYQFQNKHTHQIFIYLFGRNMVCHVENSNVWNKLYKSIDDFSPFFSLLLKYNNDISNNNIHKKTLIHFQHSILIRAKINTRIKYNHLYKYSRHITLGWMISSLSITHTLRMKLVHHRMNLSSKLMTNQLLLRLWLC